MRTGMICRAMATSLAFGMGTEVGEQECGGEP